MAIQLTSMIVTALQHAAGEPAGVALVGHRSAPGLFAATAAGRQAAQRCKDDGLLSVLRVESPGRKAIEVGRLTEKGLDFLLEQTSPRPALEALVQAIDRCEAKLRDLVGSAALQHQHLESLRTLAARMLDRIAKAPAADARTCSPDRLHEPIERYLRTWHDAGRLGDCPLPELYRQIQASAPTVTLGAFHDALRSLHEKQLIYLHPWTGPLYELPEPALALLAGHEIAYYASWRARALAA